MTVRIDSADAILRVDQLRDDRDRPSCIRITIDAPGQGHVHLFLTYEERDRLVAALGSGGRR